MKNHNQRRPAMERRDLNQNLAMLFGNDNICIPGYVPLDENPEIMTACRRIAELIGSMTIHLMNSTEEGHYRIINELSKMIDITPMPNMTRSTWMQGIVMTMLLYGKGNAIVKPHTRAGMLKRLEPIAADRVSFINQGRSDYKVLIDGVEHNPGNLLHFVYNPDKYYLWKGKGVYVSLKDIAENLKQAEATTKGFMESKFKPSVIIKVDAMSESFASPEGRNKILEDYIQMDGQGKPWIVPGEQIDIETVKPLSLNDLAIKDTVELDKKTVAAILGVPPFLLGVGEYNKEAWNSFVQNTIRPIALSIAQEMTKKLIISPNWYLTFNIRSLMDWDLQTLSSVYGELRKQGVASGNEVRDVLGLSPIDGLDELVMLENYLPADRLGDQKKLIQEGE